MNSMSDARRLMPALVVLVVYALLMLAAGLYAFTQAVPGRGATAIMVPAAGLILVLKGKPKKIVAHAAMALPILFGALFAMPASGRTTALENYKKELPIYEALAAEGKAPTDADGKRAYFRERKASDHDITYLVRTLWFLVGLSALALVALFLTRPRPAAPEAT
jgi:hypothetical protein